MARLLLTGATGFIGAAVLARLVTEGHDVVALHSGRTLPPEQHGVSWHALDLLRADEEEIAALVSRERLTHCIHTAWYTNHSDYLIAAINLDWLAASLRLASGFRAGGGQRFTGLGTCLEYDVTVEVPLSETETPLRPDTLYARCKDETRERLRAEQGEGLSVAWVRVFFVYGPGDRDRRLIPWLIGNLARGEPVAPRNGGVRRDYVHVDDLAAQICRVSAASFDGAVNGASGKAERLADIFRLAGALAGREDLVTVNDRLAADEPALIAADMSLYRDRIGAVEARSLGDGLASLIGRSS